MTRLDASDPVAILDAVEAEAIERARAIGCLVPVVRRRQWRCRLLGQDSTIDLDLDDAAEARDAAVIASRFTAAFELLHGHPPVTLPI